MRIFVQPSVFGFPTVHPVMASRLSEVIELAAKHSLRVHLTLFDWWSQYTDIDGSKEWVPLLLSRYRDDPRIAVVEPQNEVDPRIVRPRPGRPRCFRTCPPSCPARCGRCLPRACLPRFSPCSSGSSGIRRRTSGTTTTMARPGMPTPCWKNQDAGGSPSAVRGRNRLQHEAAPGDQAAQEQAQAAYYRGLFTAAAALDRPPGPVDPQRLLPGAIPPQSPAVDEPVE